MTDSWATDGTAFAATRYVQLITTAMTSGSAIMWHFATVETLSAAAKNVQKISFEKAWMTLYIIQGHWKWRYSLKMRRI